jgi:RNA polymerase sigma-70 factor (ECF subfamily)
VVSDTPALEPATIGSSSTASPAVAQAGALGATVVTLERTAQDEAPADDEADSSTLSVREREVVRLYASGETLARVARQLGLQETTVEQYLARARLKYLKAGRPAHTRIALYKRAVEDGILSGPAPSAPPTERVISTDSPDVLQGALQEAAAAGDERAAATLMTTIQPLVLRYCRARVGRGERSFASAEDIAQEVLVEVLAQMPHYQSHGRPFLAFVYGIAAHKIADAQRAAAKNRTEPVGSVPDTLEETDDTPEEAVVTGELSRQMATLLRVLPDKQREILLLRIVVGLSAEETAAAVGTTTAAVRTAQHRALQRLRNTLAVEVVPD